MKPAMKSLEEIRNWLLDELRRELDTDSPVDSGSPLADYGLESRSAIAVTGDLESWLGIELDPTIFFDYPTIDELARFLLDELAEAQ